MRLLVNVNDGSVVPLEGTYLVVLGEGKDKGRKQDLYDEWLDNGSDRVIAELGATHGKSVDEILGGCGYGDLRYGNSVAVSPNAVKEEIDSRINTGIYDNEELALLETFNVADYEWIGESILSGNILWGTFSDQMDEFIWEAIHQKRKERDEQAEKEQKNREAVK